MTKKNQNLFSGVPIPDELKTEINFQEYLSKISPVTIQDVEKYIINFFPKDKIWSTINTILDFSKLHPKLIELYTELLIFLHHEINIELDPVLIGNKNGLILRRLFKAGIFSLEEMRHLVDMRIERIGSKIYHPFSLYFGPEFGLSAHDAHYHGIKQRRHAKLISNGYTKLKEMLEYGYQKSSIQYALKYDSIDLLKGFIEKDGDINRNTKGSAVENLPEKRISLLSFAAFYGSINCFNYLYEQGAALTREECKYVIAGASKDVLQSSIDHYGVFDDAMEYAVKYHNVGIIDWLQTHKANPSNILECSEANFIRGVVFYSIPPRLPSRTPESEVQRLAKEYINQVDGTGKSSLFYTARNGSTALGSFLIEKGADVNLSDDQKVTPLIEAVKNGNIDFVKLLLENHADVSLKTIDGTSALHVAALKGGPIFDLILSRARESDIAAADKFGTPLHYASKCFTESNGKTTTEILLQHGADPNSVSESGAPFRVAMSYANAKAAVALLDYGAEKDDSAIECCPSKMIRDLVRSME